MARVWEFKPGRYDVSLHEECTHQAVDWDNIPGLDDLEDDYVLALLNLSTEAHVVMENIEIHAEMQDAINTGLFGVCGDALLQLLDLAEDEAKIVAISEYAKALETSGFWPYGEDWVKFKTVKEYNDRFLEVLAELKGLSFIKSKLRPAIAVRLCDRMVRDRFDLAYDTL